MASKTLVISNSAYSRQTDNATDTAEVTHFSFIIPANTLKEGNLMLLRHAWRHSNSAGVKNARVYVGSTMIRSIGLASNASVNDLVTIIPRGSNSLIAPPQTAAAAFSQSTGDLASYPIDWTIDQTITLRSRWAANVSGEFAELEFAVIDIVSLG